MSVSLDQLAPAAVFRHFAALSAIPRPSFHEQAVADHLMAFAGRHGLAAERDALDNVIIRKPGSPGYEDAPVTILQGHTDMVCEKNEGNPIDFTRDPISLRVEGDLLKADGTTLGADNGIAVAFMLALLESTDIPHPPLEAVFTSQEEVGLRGAAQLDTSGLKGRLFLNIDSEEEGLLFASCSGGNRSDMRLPIQWIDSAADAVAMTIQVRGLKGGHSGLDIHTPRGNAILLLGRVLHDLQSRHAAQIAFIQSGSGKSNAIPRRAEATVLIAARDQEAVQTTLSTWRERLTQEYVTADPGFELAFASQPDAPVHSFSPSTTQALCQALMLMPQGVQRMSPDIPGLVETSTNLGTLDIVGDEISFGSASRSSHPSQMEATVAKLQTLAAMIGARFELHDSYPAWPFRPESPLRELFVERFTAQYGRKPEVAGIHAGLECGVFSAKLDNVDMISFGPDIRNAHSPDECLSIASTERTWALFLNLLAHIKPGFPTP
ncbi:dipeptidase D [Pseudomonas duriflava]|uniref:Cytosol non-specific dipeptidase n=1 Tax=Pseudomonas duriflava TaxID=459528 RepID=A0A562QEE3_9PSED|nr:aminoacyl-histidine dipeptidase [Pseudomonas duriflava]TWI55063.1 dipeptidase D [Pseudomonas duriflava]